jgi:hypothetical protein
MKYIATYLLEDNVTEVTTEFLPLKQIVHIGIELTGLISCFFVYNEAGDEIGDLNDCLSLTS